MIDYIFSLAHNNPTNIENNAMRLIELSIFPSESTSTMARNNTFVVSLDHENWLSNSCNLVSQPI